MKELVKIEGEQEVLAVLEEFAPVFPKLPDKISNFAEWAKKLSKNAMTYVGVENGKRFGMFVMYANDAETKKGYISLVGVFEEYRGRRFGKFLLNVAEQVAKENGMNKIGLEVDDYNTHAQEFYRLNGYKHCGQASESSRYMEKDI